METITNNLDTKGTVYQRKDEFSSFIMPVEDPERLPTSEPTNFCPSHPEYRESTEYKIVSIKNNKGEAVRSVFDVADYILSVLPQKECTTMKLHKLLYYCQAWSMVWRERPLFKEKIEAWANGPVIRKLFSFHRGLYEIHACDMTIGNAKLLSQEQKSVIDDVINFYGDKEPQWLIDLTHSEDPWRNARKGLKPEEPGENEITLEAMSLYYSSL